jgi:nitrous oxidase accessory protein NosD
MKKSLASCWRVFGASCLAAGIAVAAYQSSGHAQETIPLTQGTVIDHSVTIRPATYRLAASADLKTPAITIRGEGIVVDFNGAALIGSDDRTDPDEFAGVAILVDGGSKVTIRGATIRGYKVAILARNSPDLHITRNDLSYNWKQRLYSGIEKESLVDWMSYHQNEKDEWLRYGAAMYLSGCDRAEIDHNTIVQGQNGLMAAASKRLKIWNNTVQFMSSIGVGLYRVTDSTIMHNRIDWCVRGYSQGFYNRGQDSAGLLMYEQSSRNTVAYNSVTHGGDGLFLWAGQSTMDTGKDGSNDNVFAANDFSHAPTNGIEATFSRNRFVGNRVEENWHGVWGGYSYESQWIKNRFTRNSEGMAIEHGQSNVIAKNVFIAEGTGIRLWQNPTQDANWGYPKNRDTRSRDYVIEDNHFLENKIAIDVRETADLRLQWNRFSEVGERLKLSGATPGLKDPSSADVGDPVEYDESLPPKLPHGMDPMIKDGERRGRHTIIVDEWGPYDWKSPKLWPVLDANAGLPFQRRAKGTAVFDGRVKLNVLGPEGVWKLVSARGASVTPTSGKIGDVISVTPASGSVVDYEFTLSYAGDEVVSPRGEVTPAGKPYQFGYSHFFAPIDWTIRFFSYPDTLDPAKDPDALTPVMKGRPITTLFDSKRIDYLSGGVIEDGVPRDRFAFVAEGTVDLPRGDYTIEVISDDGARVWVDDKVVLNEWEPHESKVDRVEITGGRRRLKLEYHELAGWAEIRFQIQPRRTRK